MERMIKQQIFALKMDALTSRLQWLQLDNKIVTLLHELWDKMKFGCWCKVEKTNEDGMRTRRNSDINFVVLVVVTKWTMATHKDSINLWQWSQFS